MGWYCPRSVCNASGIWGVSPSVGIAMMWDGKVSIPRVAAVRLNILEALVGNHLVLFSLLDLVGSSGSI